MHNGEYLGVNSKAGLSASEGDIDAGALVGHQSSQGLDLVGADVHGVPDATLARGSMVRVLRAVTLDHLDRAVVLLQREVHLENVRAGNVKYFN